MMDTAGREKRIAALASVGTAVVLLSLKVFLSFATGSLGILSEALHSGLDLIAAVITYLSVRVSDQPADAEHLYGHGKVESFSAFMETGLLVLTALYIVWEAFQRLLFRRVEIQPSLLAIGLLALMAVLDVVRSRALGRVARRFQSEALEADALHFSTDVWSTTVVIFGIACAWIGMRMNLPWLSLADPIAALGVAGMILSVGSRLGKRTIDALLDAAPPGLQQRIATAVNELEGVLSAERVRVRRAGGRHFVDVTIAVPRTASFEQVHAISDAVERRVEQIVPADVMVHMEPRAHKGEHMFDAIRAAAQRRGLAIHDLSANQVDGRLLIELHLEVDERLTLREAHRQATELEEEILRLPALVESEAQRRNGAPQVNIHIEPQGAHIAPAEGGPGKLKGLGEEVERYINGLAAEYDGLIDCHEVRARQVENKILVSCHCAMDGSLPITRVHDVMAALEDRVKAAFPQIFRVTMHPEPVEER